MLTKGNAALVAAGIKHLPPFPPVANKVMGLLARNNVSFRDVADAMRTDAALSAEVLRLANSAFIGSRNQVKSILEALALVGTERLVGLLMTLTLSKLARRCGSSGAVRRCWSHSLACALAAREFAPSFDCEIESAYLAGLFHDLGRLALLVLQPDLYEGLIEQEGDLRGLEIEHFGVDHCQTGALLVKEWKLPEIYAEVAFHHHEPGLDASKLTRVVHGACVVANQLGFSIRPLLGQPDLTDKLSFSIAESINLLECEYGF